jgi:NADPH-dependent 2,4-dienoyl-CoA reductase/sulfur reductase-like enzyme
MSSKNGRDVVIIGSGPAGLAAAVKAKEAGADDVLIVERAEELGGLLHQCIHNGFGLYYFNEDLTGPQYAHRFIEKVKDLKIDFLLETMVLDITPDKKVTLCNKRGLSTLQPEAMILAMGCRERSRQSIMIPGTRPAGVYTAGTAQRIVNVEGYLPGKEIVILGSGDVGMIMARRMTLEGATVKAVVEILPYVGGLIRNEVQCLRDFNIPLFLEHTVTEVHGLQRVDGVTIAKVDKGGEPIPGTEKKIQCDTFLLSVGLIPENELSLKAGVQLDPITNGPVVNEMMETNVRGIFAAGNVVHVNDLVDNVTAESEVAGESAAEYAMGKLASTKRTINLKVGENIRYIVPHIISGERQVTLRMRVKEPAEKVTLKIDDVLSKSLRVVKPSEMISVQLSAEQLDKIPEHAAELTVTCEKRG